LEGWEEVAGWEEGWEGEGEEEGEAEGEEKKCSCLRDP
jgi:hypothetical protein